MYWVLTTPSRVLVTGRREDMRLLQLGWRIAGVFREWEEAYAEALRLAEELDAVLEWYIDEELAAAAQKAASYSL
ncbi:MAG: hypothetical protein JZD41_05345 [Thermoproteus sp.]|nr:hypothetical protein [Thermoproteus sp.]